MHKHNILLLMEYTFLRDIKDTERQRYNQLIYSSVQHLPFTMANTLQMFYDKLGEEDYGKAKDHAIEFAEISVQWMSSYMLIRLIENGRIINKYHEKLFNVVNKIDNKRPLSFGDWVNDIFTPLSHAMFEDLADDEFTKSLAKHLFKNKVTILLGSKKEPSVVKIRNDYKAHATTLSSDIYRGVVYTLEPLIISLLEATEPLHKYEYISHIIDGDGNSKYLSLSGTKTTTTEAIDGIEPNHYYVIEHSENGDKLHDIFPLIHCSDEGYVYVFQSLDTDVWYDSANVNAIRVQHDLYNDEFDALLQNVVPSFDISRDLNWDEIQVIMSEESQSYLSRIYKEKKYNRELFIERKQLSDMLHKFYDSDKNLFPLLGEAGQGKTNQLCYWVEQHIEHKEGVLIFNSSDFSVMSLDSRIRNIFGFSKRRDISRLISDMHCKAKQNNRYIYVFFDAINECLSYFDNADEPGPLALYNELKRIFIQEEYTNIKLLFTCRNYSWKTIFSKTAEIDGEKFYYGENRDLQVMRGFTDEELHKAYDVYSDLYQMKTSFCNLSRMAHVRLKDPLVLKIASINYLSEKLPDNIHDYTSITLFDKMYNDIKRSYAGEKQCSIILLLGEYILSKYENGTSADSISEEILKKAYHDKQSPLHELSRLIYKNDSSTIAYIELINKPERPILRMVDLVGSDSKNIQFIYERFLEYIMARVFIKRHRSKLNHDEPIAAEVFLKELSIAKQANVVFMGMMRNAIIMDAILTHNYSTILTLARDHSDDFETMSLVTDVCNTLIRENYEDEIFSLIECMLDEQIDNGNNIIKEFNSIIKKIDNNLADNVLIARYKELYAKLSPILRLRNMASLSTINGLLLSDYFNEGLYKRDPFELVWRLICDPIEDVGNDTCMYIYYLNNRHYTLEYSPLKENLAERIAREMYDCIKSHSLISNLAVGKLRKRTITFLVAAVRITTILIIDAMMSGEAENRERVNSLIGDIRDIMSYLTFRWILIRIVMPFIQIIMRKQITFQSIYVNNAMEYQAYWEEGTIPEEGGNNLWDKGSLAECTKFISYATCDKKEQERLEIEFKEYADKLCSCYHLGDSFSFFTVERMLIIMGARKWDNIRELFMERIFEECRNDEWFDYSQMSLLYVLFQIGINKDYNDELLALYERECEDWTLRCRGIFRSRNSYKANPKGYYKRNVMSWYGAIYCNYAGDGKALDGDSRCVPLFYKLIDKAIDERDKELLFHLIENISELVCDFGFKYAALDLLGYMLSRIDSIELLNAIDSVEIDRDGIYSSDMISIVGNVLSTIKNYYPDIVDSFIQRELSTLKFPGVSRYREDILNYNPSGETMSDLLTHKFGKFVVWALLNESAINDFAKQAISGVEGTKNCFEWYDKTVRLGFKSLFNVKL